MQQEAPPSYAIGQARWPEVRISPERLIVYLDERDHATGSASPSACDADLYLACACSDGDPVAQELFTRTYQSVIQSTLRNFSALGHELDDAVQRTLDRLLVSRDEGPAKISQYSGRS